MNTVIVLLIVVFSYLGEITHNNEQLCYLLSFLAFVLEHEKNDEPNSSSSFTLAKTTR